jgi:pimeloyl-ACP methyl ester carboxylesterase
MGRTAASRRSFGWRMAAFIAVCSIVLVAHPARTHLRAASLLTRFAEPSASGALSDVERAPVEVTPFTMPTPTGSQPAAAKLYRPTGVAHPPGLVLLHGVHRLGIAEPRLVKFAQTIAAAGVAVLTPELRDLADYRIDPASLDTIGVAAHALRQRLDPSRAVGVMGMSFAGGLALVAAADARFIPDIAFVVAVGAHHDLARVLRFFATNSIELVDGSRQAMHAHDYGPLVVAYSYAEDFFPADDLLEARDALRLWLWEDRDAARARAKNLSPPSREKLEALFAHDVSSIAPELLAEIERRRASLAQVSPSAHLANVRCPVFLLHGAGDSVIPASETAWLARDVPRGLLRQVLVSHAIEHVELHGTPSVGDRWALVHFMAGVLEQMR